MCERHHGHAEWRENGERIPASPLRLALGCAPTIYSERLVINLS